MVSPRNAGSVGVPFASNMARLARSSCRSRSRHRARCLICAMTNRPVSSGAIAASVMSSVVVCSAPMGRRSRSNIWRCASSGRCRRARQPITKFPLVDRPPSESDAARGPCWRETPRRFSFRRTRKRCARMRSFSALVGPDDDEAAVGQARHRRPDQRFDLGRCSPGFPGPDSESASKVRSFSCGLRARQLLDPCDGKAEPSR